MVKDSSVDSVSDVLLQLAYKLKVDLYEENTVLFRYGDVSDRFYFVLGGNTSIWMPCMIEVEMTSHEYFQYLTNLMKLNEVDLLEKSLKLNEKTFLHITDLLMMWKQSGNDVSKFKNKVLIMYGSDSNYEIDAISEGIIKPPMYKNTEEIIKNMTAEEYLNCFSLDNFKTKPEDQHLYSTKKHTCSVYIQSFIKDLGKGASFGADGLKSKNKKRNANILIKDDTYLGSLDSKGFNDLIKVGSEKTKRAQANFLLSSQLLLTMNKVIFQKYFFSMFVLTRFNRGDKLIKEGTEYTHVYFVKEGDFELTINNN